MAALGIANVTAAQGAHAANGAVLAATMGAQADRSVGIRAPTTVATSIHSSAVTGAATAGSPVAFAGRLSDRVSESHLVIGARCRSARAISFGGSAYQYYAENSEMAYPDVGSNGDCGWN
jgi:hypothetical protein